MPVNMNISLTEINFGLTVILLLLVIWNIFRVFRLDAVRKHFYSQGLKKNLENIVTEQNVGIGELRTAVEDLNHQTETIRNNNRSNFQKMGFVKFSQFGEAGNLSFALVLLDDHLNGVAISSLHSREGVRIYGKDIANGKSKAKLTEEEQQAFNQAIHGQE